MDSIPASYTGFILLNTYFRKVPPSFLSLLFLALKLQNAICFSSTVDHQKPENARSFLKASLMHACSVFVRIVVCVRVLDSLWFRLVPQSPISSETPPFAQLHED